MELRLQNLTKQYGAKCAVNHLNLSLTNGVYGLLGANGAGKSTLMGLLCGVIRPTAGEIQLGGKRIQALGEHYRKYLGYLPQHNSFYPDFTALDFLLYMGALKGLSPGEARQRSRKLLKEVGLEDQARHKIRTFSGGMMQRLGIAQAMLNDPRLLILDEPTAGLDPRERIRFRNLISSFAANRMVLLSTHIVSDVEAIAEEILMMKEGEIVYAGAPEEITAAIRGSVWELTLPTAQAERFAEGLTVSNLRNLPQGQTILRVISDRAPSREAQAAEPNLEDLYLVLFGESDS